MTKTKKEMVDLLYNGRDPFSGFTDRFGEEQADDFELFEWGSKHHFIHESLKETKATKYLETGSWKGGSAIHAALYFKENNIDGVVVCIDTWLGCHLLFKHAAVQGALKREFGRPNLWQSFYANCIKYGVKDYILPIHMDSQSGLKLLSGKHRNHFRWNDFDVAYIDSSHISPMVYLDFQEAWDCLRKGGHIIGDDYQPGQTTVDFDASDFRGVEKDIRQFAQDHGLEIDFSPNKARLIKNV
jgi:predicted O-methyltransferase YrrM